jgi:hypothetical protein
MNPTRRANKINTKKIRARNSPRVQIVQVKRRFTECTAAYVASPLPP